MQTLEISDNRGEEKDFVVRLRRLSLKVWEKELFNRPFLLDLFEGKLPREDFRRYLIQDYHYLARFARAMAMAAARAEDEFAMRCFATHLKVTLDYEYPRLWKLMTRFDVRKSTLDNSTALPGTIAYTDFIFDTCCNCSSAEAVMSIYACNFSYKELGKKIRPALKKYYRIPDKFISFSLYQKRIFRDMAQDTLEVLSRGASKASPAEEERYLGKFYQGTNFEKEFWDQAYGSRR